MLIVRVAYLLFTLTNLYLHWRHNVENKPFSKDKEKDEGWDMLNRVVMIFNSGWVSIIFGFLDPFFFIGFGMLIPFVVAVLIKENLHKRRSVHPRE